MEDNLWTSNIESIGERRALSSIKIKEDNSIATCGCDAKRSVLSSRSVSKKETERERERKRERQGQMHGIRCA